MAGTTSYSAASSLAGQPVTNTSDPKFNYGTSGATVAPIIRGVSDQLGPSTFSAAGSLANAQYAAYPFLSGYIKNLSSPWGQQAVQTGERNALVGAAPAAGNAAGSLAAQQGLGQGAIEAAQEGAVQNAYRTANSTQAASATPEGQAAQAASVSQLLAQMGQIPGLQDLLAIRSNLNGTPQQQSPLGSIFGSVLGAGATLGSAAIKAGS